ncbi:hypothetical protein I553_0546 [Mycobacterium xenopi 4042]|uniref:Uncharacterized protein n=1 Tax=Mycobacterium xenopi 4042 TaxID=1299334 RepID=X7YHW2_MYCXE|nr:hypothetical protein I553_0546 [Mycobacterium xenopi 4042]
MSSFGPGLPADWPRESRASAPERFPTVRIGIGIDTGVVIAGTIGGVASSSSP